MGESFGPFEKGKTYKLRFFEAMVLIKLGIVKLTLQDKCDNVDVQRYAITERDDQRLVLRDNNLFLNKVKEFKSILEDGVNQNIKPKIDLDRYLSYFENIINTRLQKLLRLSRSEISLDDEKLLTISEKILYGRLYRLILEWRNFFLKTGYENAV